MHGAAIIGDHLGFDGVDLQFATVFFFMVRTGEENRAANSQNQGRAYLSIESSLAGSSNHRRLLQEVASNLYFLITFGL